MSRHIHNHFYRALKKEGVIALDKEASPPKKMIAFGKFRIIDNIDLAVKLCDFVALETKVFWSFIEFKKLQNTTPEKPLEPNIEDPSFLPSHHKSYPQALIDQHGIKKIRDTETALNFYEANKTYKQKLSEYQQTRSLVHQVRSKYDFDENGYVSYVIDFLKQGDERFVKDFFFAPRTHWISESSREKHTFITGGTGSGKSESMKHLIRHYLINDPKSSILILDPHAKIADEVARFEENVTNDKLVYIRPKGLFKNHFIAFNLFDLPAKDEDTLNVAQLQYLGAIQNILGEELTKPQRSILIPCLGVMIHKDNMTFEDLVRFMDDEKNKDLVAYGRSKLPNSRDRVFFQDQFHARNFNPTKEALQYRLNEIIRDPVIREFLCKKSTFNFIDLIEQGKLIVFSFKKNKQSDISIETIGQLITAFVSSYAMQRGEGNGRNIHLFADECQYFVSPTISQIMGEARKFGLWATLATQRTDQVGVDLIDAVYGNVGCYLIGRNKNKTARKMAEELPITADQVRQLESLQFIEAEVDRMPITTNIKYIGKKYGVKGKAWRDVLRQQKKLYYQSNYPPPEYQTSDTSTTTKDNQGDLSRKKEQPKFEFPEL